MTIIEHDFPLDVPVTVVIDCSPADPAAVQKLAKEASDLLDAGDLAGATDKITEARALASAGAASVTVRPLDDGELAQRQIDVAAARSLQDASDTADAAKKTLVEKLAQGKATSAEVQGALAQLLGA